MCAKHFIDYKPALCANSPFVPGGIFLRVFDISLTGSGRRNVLKKHALGQINFKRTRRSGFLILFLAFGFEEMISRT